MTPKDVRRANLIKMGFTCEKCGKVYEDGHPVDSSAYWTITDEKSLQDKCNNAVGSRTYYAFRSRRTLRNYNLFRIRGNWYKVRSSLVDMFLQLTEIEEGVQGHISHPEPINISRQVDIFTVAEKLGLSPPMNDYQQKRAKTKAFIERIKR